MTEFEHVEFATFSSTKPGINEYSSFSLSSPGCVLIFMCTYFIDAKVFGEAVYDHKIISRHYFLVIVH